MIHPIAVQNRNLQPGDRRIPGTYATPRHTITKVGSVRPYPIWGKGARVVTVSFEDGGTSVLTANSWSVVVRPTR